ncbi:MAG TPA: hypothetical protein PKL97_05105 [Candidatus Omnitrophota bacterium]|nr:hypothetical protein [Candidatus Omnitrophota bacterium]
MPYNCAVIVREIWDTRDLVGTVLKEDGGLNEAVLTTRFEPEDLNALEMALQLKDKQGGKVTAISVGQPRNVDVLRECLYRDVDAVVRVDVPSVKDFDTATLARMIANTAQKAGPFDLILAGLDIVDGENSLLGTHVAASLGVDAVTYVDALDEIAPGRVVCKRQIENGSEVVETKLPALLVVGVALLKDDPRTPRSAKATLKLKHKKTPIPVSTLQDLGIGDPASLKTTVLAGYEGIPQRVIESKQVDPNDEPSLKSMLDDIRRGG